MGKRNIQIVPGDGNINISPAEDHISDAIDSKNKKPKKEDIIVPVPKNTDKK